MSAATRNRALSSISPNVLPTDTRIAPKLQPTFDIYNDMAVPQDDSTQTTTDSAISGISALDNDTDELGRKILEHARRDQERMQNATSSTAQAFRKARPRPQVALTLENLERNNASNASGRDSKSPILRTTSISDSDRSTPPNVPKQWGRKGRQRNDFLRRINASGSAEDQGNPHKVDDPDTIYPRRTLFTGDSPRGSGDWSNAVADVPIPSIENDSPLRRSLSVPLHDRKNDTLDRIMELEQEATKARSSMSRQPSNPDIQTQQEIEALRDRAVTTNRLDEIKTGSLKTSQSLSEAFARTRKDTETEDIAGVRKVKSAAPLKGPNTVGLEGQEIQADVQRAAGRPGHKRTNSRDLLRQLARAASSTPSPPAKFATSPTRRKRDLIPSMRANSTSEITRPATSPEGGADALPTPDPTPVPDVIPSRMPKVTGAYIDTPAATKIVQLDQSETLASTSAGIQDHRAPSEPARSNIGASALADVLRTRNSTSNDDLGDATIESLHGLLDTDMVLDGPTAQALDDDTLSLIASVGDPVSRATLDRQHEDQMLQRMARSLRATRNSIRDASKGMQRVENQFEGSRSSESLCSQCVRSKHHGPVTITSLLSNAIYSLPSYFITYDSRHNVRRMKLTALGVATILVLVWFLTETTLCDMYCHSFYAPTMKGYGVDYDAPRMPWVTATVMVGWPLGWVFSPVITFGEDWMGDMSFAQAITGLFGGWFMAAIYAFGLSNKGPESSSSGSKATTSVAHSREPTVGWTEQPPSAWDWMWGGNGHDETLDHGSVGWDSSSGRIDDDDYV